MNIKEFFSKKNFERLGDLFVATWQRYPLTLTQSYLMAALVIYRIEADLGYNSQAAETIDKLLITLILGIAISLVVEAGLERFVAVLWKRLVSYGVQLGVLALYYQYVMVNYQTDAVMIRHFMLIGALLFAFTAIPYFLKRDWYEFYIIRLIARFFETLAYTIVLALGITAILFAVENLLYETLNNNLYAYTWILAFGVFAATFLLAGVPKLADTVGRDELGKVLQGIFTYVILPLLSIYSLVLYIYFFKIIFTMNWPSGMVSYLVIFSSAIGALAIFILSAVQEENRWIKNFNTWYPRTVLPLLAMMFVAIFMRIGQYGFSENRYFILLTGIWVTFSYIYFNLRKGKRNIILIIVLVAMVFLSVVGPLNAFSVSKNSQNGRFNGILAGNGMLDADGGIQASDSITDEDLNELYEVVDYFRHNHELSDLEAMPDGIGEGKDDDLEALFGAPRPEGSQAKWGNYYNFRGDEETREPLDISSYDAYFHASAFNYEGEKVNLYQDEITTDQGVIEISINENSMLLVSLDGQERYRFDLSDYGDKLFQLEKDEGYQSVQDAMVVREENDDVQVIIYLQRLRGNLLTEGIEDVELECFVDLR